MGNCEQGVITVAGRIVVQGSGTFHEQGMMDSVPNQPKTPHMSFRIDGDLKRDVLHLAKINGESASDIVRRAFENYCDEYSHLLKD